MAVNSEVVAELITRLGYKVDSKGIIQARNQISTFKSFALKAFGAIGAIRLGMAAYRFTADLDVARASMEALTGSTEKTQEMMDQLRSYSERLRPSWAQFGDAAKQLLVYGVEADKVVGITKQLTDVSGGSIERFNRLAYAIGQINAAGYLKGTELRQLTEAGFDPLSVISEKTGRSRAELIDLIEKRAISLSAVYKALDVITGEGGRFFGMAEKQANTLSGSFDVLRNNIMNFTKDLVEYMSPGVIAFNKRLTAVVQNKMKTWVKDNQEAIKNFVVKGLVIFEQSVVRLKNGFVALWPAIKIVLLSLPMLIKLFVIFKALQLGVYFWSIVQAIRGWGIWTKVFIPIIAALYSWLALIAKAKFAMAFEILATSIRNVVLGLRSLIITLTTLMGVFLGIYATIASIYSMSKNFLRIRDQKEYNRNLKEQLEIQVKIAEQERTLAKLKKESNTSDSVKKEIEDLERWLEMNKSRKAYLDQSLENAVSKEFVPETIGKSLEDFKKLPGIAADAITGTDFYKSTKRVIGDIGTAATVPFKLADMTSLGGVSPETIKDYNKMIQQINNVDTTVNVTTGGNPFTPEDLANKVATQVEESWKVNLGKFSRKLQTVN